MSFRLLICDDHPLFRDAMRGAVGRSLPDTEVVEAGGFEELLDLLQSNDDFDLLLLDLHMPGTAGLSGLVYVRAHHPTLPVTVVSGDEDARVVRRALAHGAMGFIPKSASLKQIGAALSAILDGETWIPNEISGMGVPLDQVEADTAQRLKDLTPTQFKVLAMVTSGLLNKQIAFELKVSEATVKAHMTAVMRKLKVSNRTQAVLAVSRLAIDPGAVSACEDSSELS